MPLFATSNQPGTGTGNPFGNLTNQPANFGTGWNPSMLGNSNPQGGIYGQPGAFGNPAAQTGENFDPNAKAGGYQPQYPQQNQMANNGPAPGAEGGGGSNPSATVSSPFGSPGWQPQFQQNLGGYNPNQYATLDTANQLAQALGGNVNQTQMGPGSPFNIPNQASINFGSDSNLNAGLLANRYAKHGLAQANQMTQDELKFMAPSSSPNEDSIGGTLGSWSQFQPLQGGGQFLGQGANLGSAVGTAPGGAFGSQAAQQQNTGIGSGGNSLFGQSNSNPYTQNNQNQGFNFQNPNSMFGGGGNQNQMLMNIFQQLFGGGGQRQGGSFGNRSFATPGGGRMGNSPFGAFPGSMMGLANFRNSFSNPNPGWNPANGPQTMSQKR